MKRVRIQAEKEVRMKKEMMLMGLWTREGEKTPEELQEELLRRLEEIPSREISI